MPCEHSFVPAVEDRRPFQFVAITDDGSSRKGHHQTVGKLQTPAIPLQHGNEPASNPALVQLHVVVGPKCREDSFALFFSEAPQIEFIVIAKERSLLGRRWTGIVSMMALTSGPESPLASARKRR